MVSADGEHCSGLWRAFSKVGVDSTDDSDGDDGADDGGDVGGGDDDDGRRVLLATDELRPTGRRVQDDDCSGRIVARELARVFESTYTDLTSQLCDPFRRLIESITCRSEGFDSDFSGTLECKIAFRCSGPCGEWVDETAIYQQADEFVASNSCVCDSGGARRAPYSTDHIAAINAALTNGLSIRSIEV